MESKLKALKVVDLKAILQQASVPIGGKANKADLIAKILASPEAIQAFHSQNAPATPSEPIPPPAPTPAPAPAPTLVSSVPKPTRPPVTSIPSQDTPAISEPLQGSLVSEPSEAKPAAVSQTAPATDEPQDAEIEKLKARAARFGIQYQEPAPALAPNSKTLQGKTKAVDPSLAANPDQVKARNARFGSSAAVASTADPVTATTTQNGNRNKRQKEQPVDADEEERRRKRAARFGLGGSADPEEEERRKKRAARFGLEK